MKAKKRELHLPLQGFFWTEFFDKDVQKILNAIRGEHGEVMALCAFGRTQVFCKGKFNFLGLDEYIDLDGKTGEQLLNQPRHEDTGCAGFSSVYRAFKLAPELLSAIDKAHSRLRQANTRKSISDAMADVKTTPVPAHFEYNEDPFFRALKGNRLQNFKSQATKYASAEAKLRMKILKSWPEIKRFVPKQMLPPIILKK